MQRLCEDFAALKSKMEERLSGLEFEGSTGILAEMSTFQEQLIVLSDPVKNQGTISEKQVLGGQLKRQLPPADDERPAKLERHRDPQLPADVLVLVLKYLSVRDIGNARLSCRMWRDAIDQREAELWEARCNLLGLLPPEGTDTVLGRAANRARACIVKIRANASKDTCTRTRVKIRATSLYYCEICSIDCVSAMSLQSHMKGKAHRLKTKSIVGFTPACIYRKHYLTFASFISGICTPCDLGVLQPDHTAPSDFKWLRLSDCLWWLNNTWPFANKLWSVMDFRHGSTVVIDERAPVPNRVLPDVFQGGQLRKNVFVSYNDFSDICERYAAARRSNDVIDIPRVPVPLVNVDAE